MYSITVGKEGYLPDTMYHADTLEEARECLLGEIVVTDRTLLDDSSHALLSEYREAVSDASDFGTEGASIVYGEYVHSATPVEGSEY